MNVEHTCFADVWDEALERLVREPATVSPRGLECREITNAHLVIGDATQNLFTNHERNLSYRFAVAEWLWIWYGRDDVKTIAQYNRHIANFSDNGIDFNGAYGVPVQAQWQHVLQLLKNDADTRQAVIQIYRVPTGPTRDLPCTLSLQFLLRDGELNVIANMRSSDIWLGLPYDAFNFSMLGNILAGQLGVGLGYLAFNLGSSHLYSSNYEQALHALRDISSPMRSPRLPGAPPTWLEGVLTTKASLGRNDVVWDRYGCVLRAQSNSAALGFLEMKV